MNQPDQIVARLLEDEDEYPKDYVMRNLPRFKVGDYVRVVDEFDDHYTQTGRITSISGLWHHVVFDPGNHDFYYERELERSDSTRMDEEDDEDPKDYIMGLTGVYGYQNIVFMEGSDADMPFHILDNESEEAVISYLAQWDMGEGEVTRHKPWGSGDRVYHGSDNYVLSYSHGLGYIGLCRIIREFSPEARRYRDKES
jgi:hypothetical protein